MLKRMVLSADGTYCLPADRIDGCVLYNGGVSTTICSACSQDKFLANGICSNRTLTVANCANYTLNFDRCAACSSGYILSPDGTTCAASISNCIDYAFTVSGANATGSCRACMSGYRLNPDAASQSTNACVPGTISNCASYANSNSGDTCLSCTNGFFINGTVCSPQFNITGCRNYSAVSPGICGTCERGKSLFYYENSCVAISSIPNCITYAQDTGACILCSAGYFLNGTACNLIPTTLTLCDQAVISGTVVSCTRCTGASVLQDGKCFPPQNIMADNCDTLTLMTDNNTTCSACKSGSVEFPFLNSPLCFNSSTLAAVSLKPSKSNCAIHDWAMNCIQCMDGWLVRDGSCVAVTDCPSLLTYEITQSTTDETARISRRNVCVMSGATGCSEFSKSLRHWQCLLKMQRHLFNSC